MDLLNAQSETQVRNVPTLNDLGAHSYTGGTTGISKAAMLSHANISLNSAVPHLVQRRKGWGREDAGHLSFFSRGGLDRHAQYLCLCRVGRYPGSPAGAGPDPKSHR